jgi:uncharacterized protein (DUF983 family)
MNTEDKEPEYDELMKKVDDHLYTDRVGMINEARTLLVTGTSAPPLWFFLAVLVVIIILDTLFSYFGFVDFLINLIAAD